MRGRQAVLIKKRHFLSEFFLEPIQIFESELPQYFNSLLENERYKFDDQENRVFEALVKSWRERFSGKETLIEGGISLFLKLSGKDEKTPEQKFKEKFFEFLEDVAKEFSEFKDELDPEGRIPRETWMRFINTFLRAFSKQVLWPLQPADTENSIHKQFTTLLQTHIPLTGVDTHKTVDLWERILEEGSTVTVRNTEETIAQNAKIILEREIKLAEEAEKKVAAEKQAAAARELAQKQAAEYKVKEEKISKLIRIMQDCEKETAGNKLSGNYITFGKHSGSFFVNKLDEFDAEIFKKKFEELNEPEREKLLTHLVYAKHSLCSLTIGLPVVENLTEVNRIKLLQEIEAARMDLFGKIETLLLTLASDPNLLTLAKFAELNKAAIESTDDLTADTSDRLERKSNSNASEPNNSNERLGEVQKPAVKKKKGTKNNRRRAATPVVVIEDGTSTSSEAPAQVLTSSPPMREVEESANADRFTGVPSFERLRAQADVPAALASRKEEENFPLHFDEFAIGLLMNRKFPKAEEVINSRFFDSDLISEITKRKGEGSKEAEKSEAYYNQKLADINKKFNGIFYKRPGFLNKFKGQDPNISKTHFPSAINQLLNDRWKQFQDFWKKYAESHKDSEGLEPFLPGGAMRALFIGFIFSAWPSNENPTRSYSDPFNDLITALKSALGNYNFADSVTFKEWTPNFNCKFNDNFELNIEACPFENPPPQKLMQQKVQVVATLEIISEDVSLEASPDFLGPVLDEFALKAIFEKNKYFPTPPTAQKDRHVFEEALKTYHAALRGFFDIQKVFQSEVPSEDEERELSQARLRVQQVKFVSKFKPLKDSKGDLEKQLSLLLNQNWKPFLEILVKYCGENETFLYTPENLARLFEAYLLPLTSFPTGFAGEDSKSLRDLIFNEYFTDALIESLKNFSSIKELCDKVLQFEVDLSTGLLPRIFCRDEVSPDFVTYLVPKRQSVEVIEINHQSPQVAALRNASDNIPLSEAVGIGQTEDDKGKEEANVSTKQQVVTVEQISTPEERSSELIKFLVSEKSDDSRYILSLPGNPIFRVPGERISIPKEDENEGSIETETIAIGSFCLDTIKKGYLTNDDDSLKDVLLRRLIEIKMEFTLTNASKSQRLFAIEINKLISGLEPDEKNIFDISIEVSRYREIKRRSLALIKEGYETLLLEMPKLKKAVAEKPESPVISADPTSLNADESEAASVPRPASAQDVLDYNEAVEKVLLDSSKLIADHYKQAKNEQELDEARKTFAKSVRPKFEHLLESRPLLNQYQSTADKIWTRVLNAAMIIGTVIIVASPVLIIRALYRRSKGLPVLFQPKPFERVAGVLQKSVFSNIEKVEKAQIQAEKSEKIVAGALAKEAKEVRLFACTTAENALARESSLREKLNDARGLARRGMQASSE